MNPDEDERLDEVKKEFPLRQIQLNMCICGHGSEDHITEPIKISNIKIKDGACEICVCQEFKQERLEK